MAIIFAIIFPVLIGGAGLAVDYAYYTVVKGELQGAADAAAAAGAVSLASQSEARAAALALAHKNVDTNIGTIAEESDVEIGIYIPENRSFTVSSIRPNAVRVTTSRTVARANAPRAMFSAIFGHEYQEISAVAIAVAVQVGNCLHALNATASAAFYMHGSAQLSLPTCQAQVNSAHAKAATTEGEATVTSEAFNVAGGYSGGGFNPVPRTRAPQPDPYADVPEPQVPLGCTYTNRTFDKSASFTAGTRFCGATKFTNGSFSFAPGVHYFTGSSVTFETTGSVTATSAMFYFGPDVTTRIAAKGVVQLTAMQSGDYAGIAIFQSRNSSTPPKMLIEGGVSLSIDAAIYVPKTKLEMAGNSALVVSTGIIVADTVEYRGQSHFAIAPDRSRPPRSTQSALVH